MPMPHGKASPTLEFTLLALPALVFALGRPMAPAAAHAAVPHAPVERAAAHAAPAAVARAAPSTSLPGPDSLRVCADPNNMPFSNARGAGFENRIAALVAREMGRPIAYTWWAQRRGFIRSTLRAGQCDLVAGIPTSSELALVTRPYYRSTYVFVQRRDRRWRSPITSFDDPALKRLRIGVQFIGDDYSNTPPAHALAARGIVRNVKGYSIYGDYSKPDPQAAILDAVVDDSIDVAVVWGPLAGYFATTSRVPLAITPVSPQIDVPFLPFVFDISMGVRRTDPALRNTVNGILVRRRAGIDSILDAYGVPRLNGTRLAVATKGGGSAAGTHAAGTHTAPAAHR
jgi:mxaJ protein